MDAKEIGVNELTITVWNELRERQKITDNLYYNNEHFYMAC